MPANCPEHPSAGRRRQGVRSGGTRRRPAPRLSALAWALAALLLPGCVGTPDESVPTALDRTPFRVRGDAASILVGGEELCYGVAWGGFLPVGRVVYRTESLATPEGPLFVIRAETLPSALVSAFLDAGGTSEVLLDPGTWRPRAASWTTANPDDPVIRAAWFDHVEARVFTGKVTRGRVSVRAFPDEGFLDPLSTLFLARIIEFQDGEEVRLRVVEGSDRHVMILVDEGEEELVHEGKKIACRRLAVRTHRLTETGDLAETEPGNSLFAWIAEIEGRPVLRMAGRTVFGKVSLRLAQRLVGASHGT